MAFAPSHYAKAERQNDFHEGRVYFVGRTSGGPATVRYEGHGKFTDLARGREFIADIRQMSGQQCAIHPDFDAIFSKDNRARKKTPTASAPALQGFDGCTTDAERQARVTEYVADHEGAVSHASLIRVFGKDATKVCNDMLAGGLLCKFHKATTHHARNGYFALPGTPTE